MWSALFDLTQAFLVTYYAFAREVSHHAQSAKWQQPLPELLCRQIIHMGLDAKIRLYRYEQWIPAKWAELHALFTLACSRQFERQQLALGAGSGTTTIEHEFLVALLMQLMNSGNMTARHLEWVAGELDEWCAPLRLSLEPSTVTSFYVDLGAREGLRRRSPAPLEGRVLFLDTPAAALGPDAERAGARAEDQGPAAVRAHRQAQRAARPPYQARVTGRSRIQAVCPPRRRTAAAGTVDAIVGFAKISGFLREEEQTPIPQLEHGKSFGGTMELAVFGRMRNEADRTIEMARRRFNTFAAPGGPWEIKDVSQTGFRLLAPMSVANAITLAHSPRSAHTARCRGRWASCAG